MDKKTTKRILKQARLQQQQLEDEFAEEEGISGKRRPGKSGVKNSVKLGGTMEGSDESEDDDEFALVSGDEDDVGEQDKFSQEIVSLNLNLFLICS